MEQGIFSQEKLDGTKVIYKAEIGAPKAALDHYSEKARYKLYA